MADPILDPTGEHAERDAGWFPQPQAEELSASDKDELDYLATANATNARLLAERDELRADQVEAERDALYQDALDALGTDSTVQFADVLLDTLGPDDARVRDYLGRWADEDPASARGWLSRREAEQAFEQRDRLEQLQAEKAEAEAELDRQTVDAIQRASAKLRSQIGPREYARIKPLLDQAGARMVVESPEQAESAVFTAYKIASETAGVTERAQVLAADQPLYEREEALDRMWDAAYWKAEAVARQEAHQARNLRPNTDAAWPSPMPDPDRQIHEDLFGGREAAVADGFAEFERTTARRVADEVNRRMERPSR